MRSILAALFLAPLLPAQTSCIDQEFVSGRTNGLEVTNNQNVTQTFTSALTGQLVQIDLTALGHHRGTPTNVLTVEVVTVDAAGVPTPNVLARIVLQPSQVPASVGVVPIDVSAANIQVTDGQMLGIKLSSLAPSSGSTYAWWGDAPGAYTRGEIYIRNNVGPLSFDLEFRTLVVPDGTATAYGSSLGGSSGPPTLTVSTPPTIGGNFLLVPTNPLATSTPSAILIGAAAAQIPTPFGGDLLVTPLITLSPSLMPGPTRLFVQVPNDPILCGVSVFTQVLIADATAVAGVGFSQGLELVIGG